MFSGRSRSCWWWAYAASSRVRFEVGAGSAAPTQLAFAAMMVLLPPALLVPAASIGYWLGSGRSVPSGKPRWEVTLIQIAGCWYAVGAAGVMAISGVHHPSLSAVPWYCAAFAVQCTLDLLVSVFQERIVLGAPVRDLVSAMAPCWIIDCLITPVVVCVAASAPPLALASALPLLLLFRIFSQERSARYDHVMALSDAYRGTAMLLGDVVEADHQYTAAHSRDVVELSLAVADTLGLDSPERTRVEFAALLHDVGKIKVPKQILDKPGALSHEERGVINQHTIWGEEMLTGVGGATGGCRSHRPLMPRTLGRPRIPRRTRHDSNPDRGSHRVRVRRLLRHDNESPLPLRAQNPQRSPGTARKRRYPVRSDHRQRPPPGGPRSRRRGRARPTARTGVPTRHAGLETPRHERR